MGVFCACKAVLSYWITCVYVYLVLNCLRRYLDMFYHVSTVSDCHTCLSPLFILRVSI